MKARRARSDEPTDTTHPAKAVLALAISAVLTPAAVVLHHQAE